MHPVPDQIPGSVFTISGTTNLPSGSSILFKHYRAINSQESPDLGSLSEMIVVTAGDGTENVWQCTVDSSGFPDRQFYVVGVSAKNSSSASGSYRLMYPGDT